MFPSAQPRRIPLPRHWTGVVRSAVVHTIALAQYAAVYTRCWARERSPKRSPARACTWPLPPWDACSRAETAGQPTAQLVGRRERRRRADRHGQAAQPRVARRPDRGADRLGFLVPVAAAGAAAAVAVLLVAGRRRRPLLPPRDGLHGDERAADLRICPRPSGPRDCPGETDAQVHRLRPWAAVRLQAASVPGAAARASSGRATGRWASTARLPSSSGSFSR